MEKTSTRLFSQWLSNVPKNEGKISRFARFILLLFGVTFVLMLGSCRDELEIYKIERDGVFSYSIDDITTQFANNVNFFQGKTVVHTFDDGQVRVYTRYLLEARGKNTAGKNVIFDIEFDLINTSDYIGIYRPVYEPAVGGIYSFNYLVETSTNQYESYNLDPEFIASDFFRVERQNKNEKLILGDFRAHLRNDKNPDIKIVFYEGNFKDISYALY